MNNAQCNGSEEEDSKSSAVTPPEPENVPVFAPLTVEDVIKMDTSTKNKPSDNDSMIVNPDETQSEMDFSVSESQSLKDENVTEDTQEETETPMEEPAPTVEENSAADEKCAEEVNGSTVKDNDSAEADSKDIVSPSETNNSSVEQSAETSTPLKAKRFVF